MDCRVATAIQLLFLVVPRPRVNLLLLLLLLMLSGEVSGMPVWVDVYVSKSRAGVMK